MSNQKCNTGAVQIDTRSAHYYTLDMAAAHNSDTDHDDFADDEFDDSDWTENEEFGADDFDDGDSYDETDGDFDD